MNKPTAPLPAWSRPLPDLLRRRLVRALPWSGWALAAAPGIAGAAAPARTSDYPPVLPGRGLRFARDHGAHPDYRTEWWYLTAWLDTPRGPMGCQLTFFRSRTPWGRQSESRFAPRQLLFAHAAIGDPRHGRIRHAERARRVDGPAARFDTADTDLALGTGARRWSLRRTDADTYEVRVDADDFQLALTAATPAPPWLQGDAGFSRKGPLARQASYYYSRPQLALSGSLAVGGERLDVRGLGWLDHEWSSEILDERAHGWDWTGLNLDDGRSLMAFRIRDGQAAPLWQTANWLLPPVAAGVTRADSVVFEPLRWWTSPASAIRYPVQMRLRLAGGETLQLQPLLDDQEIDARASTGTRYWGRGGHGAR
ncbi:MAG: carotenoid 1,2-hydratase [Burkholderiaceae bacterium]